MRLYAWRLGDWEIGRLKSLTFSLNLSKAVLLLLFMAGSLLIVTACGGNASGQAAPPEIHYGEDICEFCNMIVSEERFAAGYISQDGQNHIFDDIGDMVQARLGTREEITAVFVHDHDSHTWIIAETAFYARSDKLPTPMLSGVAAFDTVEGATAFAAGLDGQVLTFEELLALYQEGSPQSAFSNGD